MDSWLDRLASWINKLSHVLGLPPTFQEKDPLDLQPDQTLLDKWWEAAIPGSPTAPQLGKLKRGHGGRTGPRILREQFLGVEEWLSSGYWGLGVSSNVTAIRYAAPKRLWVVFASRSLSPARGYRYDGVEEVTAEQMFLAPSLGKYVHEKLKGQYDYQGPTVII